jgi:hypothetical protein
MLGPGVQIAAHAAIMTVVALEEADRLAAYLGLRLTPDLDAMPPEPTPENLARPALMRRTRK